jgi:hypothetical protein
MEPKSLAFRLCGAPAAKFGHSNRLVGTTSDMKLCRIYRWRGCACPLHGPALSAAVSLISRHFGCATYRKGGCDKMELAAGPEVKIQQSCDRVRGVIGDSFIP